MRTIALTLMLAFTGCAAISSSGSDSASNPTSQIDVQVAEAPPPEKVDGDKPAAPGYGYIWVSGYWDYLDGNYLWRSGRWVQGKADYEYVRAHYEAVNNRWVFHRPHWKRRHAQGSSTEQASRKS